MLRFFPENRQAWLSALLFLFQAFPIIAFLTAAYFAGVWPHRTRWSMDDLKLFIIAGDFVCLVVLLGVGITQLFIGRRCSACLNLGLAALTVLACLPMLNFVRT